MSIERKELEFLSRSIMEFLNERFEGKVGFTVFVFEHGSDTTLAYVSSAERAGMISTVKEWLARVEAGLTTDPLGPRAKG